MNIWFPDFYTEAHRDPERQLDLTWAFTRLGVACHENYDPSCELCFCGSIFKAEHVRRQGIKIPVVHYNWDLYPWMVKNDKSVDWKSYITDLKTCRTIVVPSQCTAVRTMEYTGRTSQVILSPVKVWDRPTGIPPGGCPHPNGYVLDVMRDYPWDRSRTWSTDACRIVGIPIIRTLTSTAWNEFRWLVFNASLLLSCYEEASTGGLTLLEGYAHGVPCLVSDSHRMGAKDYLGDRALYFDHMNFQDLVSKLSEAWYRPRQVDPKGARYWVETEFSDFRFASELKQVFESCL